jgi:hypothetical protein
MEACAYFSAKDLNWLSKKLLKMIWRPSSSCCLSGRSCPPLYFFCCMYISRFSNWDLSSFSMTISFVLAKLNYFSNISMSSSFFFLCLTCSYLLKSTILSICLHVWLSLTKSSTSRKISSSFYMTYLFLLIKLVNVAEWWSLIGVAGQTYEEREEVLR